ncbi:MAG: DNA helicase RecQ [Clostridia bacterium]|nr:DNA helicase RecQ [Clostridia bacterium]
MIILETLFGSKAPDKYELLRNYYGHMSFRQGQEALIDNIMAGNDAVGIMPTGGGKSVCYQIPALMMDGITIVVSPLVSLMNDQVAALKTMGIRGAYINSSLTFPQLLKVYDRMKTGEYRIIYVAPERLASEGFLAALSYQKVSMVAVDEAHCISQWGNDFRPSYLRISEFIDFLPERPVVAAFTATATDEVRNDIIRLLKLKDPHVEITGYDRKNLYFDVIRPKNKLKELFSLLNERRDKSGIIYCSTRKSVEEIAAALEARGYASTCYHAGMEQEERQRNQDDFQYDRKRVMVATNAFGMGIDKSNVSYVIHYNMPKSIEAYYQEAGRAGRDGEEAECIMMFSKRDVQIAEYFIENPEENEELTEEQQEAVKQMNIKRLHAMLGYVGTRDCFRGKLLEYFGEKHPPFCGKCGNCGTDFKEQDITKEAQMLLSCVKRAHTLLGYYVGENLIVNTVFGSRLSRLKELGLDTITTYAVGKNYPLEYLREVCDYLISLGYLKVNEHKGIELTEKSGTVLFGKKKLNMKVRADTKRVIHVTRESTANTKNMFEVLRQARFNLSLKEHVPAYIILTDAVLNEIAIKEPQNMDELLQIPGIGKTKANKYGKAFLDAIKTAKENQKS